MCGNTEGECDHLPKFICPIFTPPTNIAVCTTAWINWAAVCSGRRNPQLQTCLLPEFLGKAAAAEPMGFLSPTKQRHAEPNFKEAFSNNQKVWKKKKKFNRCSAHTNEYWVKRLCNHTMNSQQCWQRLCSWTSAEGKKTFIFQEDTLFSQLLHLVQQLQFLYVAWCFYILLSQ